MSKCLLFQTNWQWQSKDPVAFKGVNTVVYTEHHLWETYVPSKGWAKAKWLHNFQSKFGLEKCVALLLPNIASVGWIRVNCSVPIAHNILCVKSDFKSVPIKHDTPSDLWCQDAFLKSKQCYQVKWINTKCLECTVVDQSVSLVENLKAVEYLFHSLPGFHFGPIFHNDFSTVFTVEKELQFVTYTEEKNTSVTEGYLLRVSQAQRPRTGTNTFTCKEGKLVLITSVCDNHRDCSESASSSDEWNCFDKSENQTKMQRFLCSQFYFRTKNGTCYPFYEDARGHIAEKKNTESSVFVCNNLKVIAANLVNDLEVDCPLTGEDESHLLSMRHNFQSFVCSMPDQIPCQEGHSKCFNISQTCLYLLNDLRHLTACRTGDHLANCSLFECHSHYKCQHFYCIPWDYKCDGKWDCPRGNDESPTQRCRTSRKCSKLFQCRFSTLCVHVSQICDGKTDCPKHDDEKYCAESELVCPTSCTCLLSAVVCNNLTLFHEQLAALFQIKSVSVKKCILNKPRNAVSKVATIFLSVLYSSFEELCNYFGNNNTLLYLDVRFNGISDLKPLCFQEIEHLVVSDISSNNITIVKTKVFTNNAHLKFINISLNPIFCFQETIVSTMSNILYISFQTNFMRKQGVKLGESVFDQMKFLRIFDTDQFSICCFLPEQAECTALIPWFLSCDNLLPSTILKALFYMFSLSVLLLNLFSAGMQIVSFHLKKQQSISNGILVVFINMSDGILSLPLFILCAFDLIYHNIFILHESEWRSSVACYIVFGFFLLFNKVSPTSLCFLSFQRFQLVRDPIKTNFQHSSFVVKKLCGALLTSLLLCFCLTYGTFWEASVANSALPTSLCSPFVDPVGNIRMVTVLMGIAVAWQTFCVLFILASNVLLSIYLNKSKKISKTSNRGRINLTLVLQVVLVSLSNLICWIPSSIVYVVSALLERYPVQMIIWTTIVVVPINSVVNPMIFCVVVLRKFRQQRFQRPAKSTTVVRRS